MTILKKSYSERRIFCAVIVLAIGTRANSSEPPPAVDAAFAVIRAQEANFSLPDTTSTITVGRLDLAQTKTRIPGLTCLVENYDPGKVTIPGAPNNRHNRGHGNRHPGFSIDKCAPKITVANVRHLNLRFEVTHGPTDASWRSPGSSVTFQVGGISKTVAPDASDVIFSEISSTDVPLSIHVIRASDNLNATIPGVEDIRIVWQLLGAGALVIPVIPVSIVYGPTVDAQRKNTNAASAAVTRGNTTSISFINERTDSVIQRPVAETLIGMSKQINSATEELTGPEGKAFGKALDIVSAAVGKASTMESTGISATSQSAFSISQTDTSARTALASQGGPGVSDLFTYYYNVRTVWFSKNGSMALAILGWDGEITEPAFKLAQAQGALQSKPKGSVDATVKLTAEGIQSLLNLDPFVNGRSHVAPPTGRFEDITQGPYSLGGGNAAFSRSYTVNQSDLKQVAITRSRIDSVTPGFLHFVGIGPSDEKTVTIRLSQTSSSQASTGHQFTTQTQLFTNGAEQYAFWLYFDTVFNAFAFQDIDLASAARVDGLVVSNTGMSVRRQIVTAEVAGRHYQTVTDDKGRFQLVVPDFRSGRIELASGSTVSILTYVGRPIDNVKVRAR